MLLYFQVVFKIAYISRKPDKMPKTKKNSLSLSCVKQKFKSYGSCAPAIVCSSEEENEDDFFESSSLAKACSSTTPLSKFLVFRFFLYLFWFSNSCGVWNRFVIEFSFFVFYSWVDFDFRLSQTEVRFIFGFLVTVSLSSIQS